MSDRNPLTITHQLEQLVSDLRAEKQVRAAALEQLRGRELVAAAKFQWGKHLIITPGRAGKILDVDADRWAVKVVFHGYGAKWVDFQWLTEVTSPRV